MLRFTRSSWVWRLSAWLIAALLCGTSPATPVWADAQPIALNYVAILRENGIAKTLLAQSELQPVEVSTPRRAFAPVPGDWIVCLRLGRPGLEKYISFYFVGNDIRDARTSVIIDHCDAAQYHLLEHVRASAPPSVARTQSSSDRSHRLPAAH
jgi:hypothetical protein